VRRWASTLADEHEAWEPLDLDRTVAYRFGNLSHLTRRPHLSVCLKTNPAPCERFSGPARSGFIRIWPSLFRIGPFHFYLNSRPFELFHIWFRYDFQT
jgi:hypothetical protein